MGDRQLDISATRPDWFTLPRYLPMRLSAVDFVFFKWQDGFNFQDYQVVVEVLDNAGPPYRSISPLKRSVELPHIQYGWHARIGVVPNSSHLPLFEAELNRGSTYIIPQVRRNGVYQMESLGMSRPPGL